MGLSMLAKVEATRRRAERIASTVRSARTDTLASLGFVDFLAQSKLDTPPHVRQIARIVEDAAAKREVRAVIAMPPRHGKTETFLRAFAWMLAGDPRATMGYATYSADLARSKSRLARRYALDAGVTLANDSANLSEWRTREGGGLLATGAGGALTGQGINRLLLIDDPIKNRQEAESSLIRERIWDWFTDVAYTRLEPGASVIIVATRWHPDDLSGRLIADGWTDLTLPAVDDDGRALWPERYPRERLDEIAETVGAYTWASLYQGRPRPRGGALFRDAFYYEDLPSSGYREAVGVDFAYSERTHADYSVLIRGRAVGDVIYITDVYRAQVEIPEVAARLRAWDARHNLARIGGTEKGVVSFLRRDYGIKLDTIPASTDKHAFAQPVSAAWNAGKVLIPRDAPWLSAFLDEILGFTGIADKHDDQVDALGALHHALIVKPKPNLAALRRASGL